MLKKSFLKIILLFFIFSLFWNLNLFYNKNKELLAQNEVIIEKSVTCEVEIPVGKVIDEAKDLSEEILVEFNNIYNNTNSIILKSQNLIGLADECRQNNCQTGCDKWSESYDCNCVTICDLYGYGCSTTCDTCYNYYCDVNPNPCAGNACSFSNIEDALDTIEINYNEISNSYDKLQELIEIKSEGILCPNPFNPYCKTKPEKVLELLNETPIYDIEENLWERGVRESVKECQMSLEEINKCIRGEIACESLMSCSLAKDAEAIDEEICQDPTYNFDCYCFNGGERADNFFCCYSTI